MYLGPSSCTWIWIAPAAPAPSAEYEPASGHEPFRGCHPRHRRRVHRIPPRVVHRPPHFREPMVGSRVRVSMRSTWSSSSAPSSPSSSITDVCLERVGGLATGQREIFGSWRRSSRFSSHRHPGLSAPQEDQGAALGPGPVGLGAGGGRRADDRGRTLASKKGPGREGLEHVTPKRALLIGLGQCVSIWPGSRDPCAPSWWDNCRGSRRRRRPNSHFCSGSPRLVPPRSTSSSNHGPRSRAWVCRTSPSSASVVSFLVAWAVMAAFLAYFAGDSGSSPSGSIASSSERWFSGFWFELIRSNRGVLAAADGGVHYARHRRGPGSRNLHVCSGHTKVGISSQSAVVRGAIATVLLVLTQCSSRRWARSLVGRSHRRGDVDRLQTKRRVRAWPTTCPGTWSATCPMS